MRDIVRRCAGLSPADPEYFSDSDERVAAADDDVLWGDVLRVDSGEDFAQSDPLVHLQAVADLSATGGATFNGRHVGGSGRDRREPLGTRYALRFLAGGPFDGGTDFSVWRDTGSAAAGAFPCPPRGRSGHLFS